MNKPYKYDFFVSYVASDRNYVEALHQELARVGIRSFFDGIASAEFFPDRFRALSESAAIIFVATRESIRSEWVLREIEVFLGTSKEWRDIFVISVDGAFESRGFPGTRYPWHLAGASPRAVLQESSATLEEGKPSAAILQPLVAGKVSFPPASALPASSSSPILRMVGCWMLVGGALFAAALSGLGVLSMYLLHNH